MKAASLSGDVRLICTLLAEPVSATHLENSS